MAEYNKSRYYWIKLTDRFLESDTVDYLMSQKDGSNYVVLYQMLCLKTVNQNGVLARQLGEMIIPYDEEKIVRDCKYFSIDTVRIALTLYKNLGLIYEQENGILRISDFERLIGSQTESAEKKQIQRSKNKQNPPQIVGGQKGRQEVDICPPDIDIEKDIDIESKSKVEREIYINNYPYGGFDPPTLEQVKAVCKEIEVEESEGINFFNYYQANGWMQSRDKPILNWVAQLNVWLTRKHKFKNQKEKDEPEESKEVKRYGDYA